MKSQSAMEYLMTYGWAILVIAVVLAALYSLGIFNPNTFAPKASAGSCEVVRPFGPTTTTDVHLEGTCTNMLPKYAALFDGNDNYIISPIPTNKTVNVSFSLWYQSDNSNYYAPLFLLSPNGGYPIGYGLYLQDNEFQILESSIRWIDTSKSINSSRWYNIIFTISPASSGDVIYSIYLDGRIVYASSPESPSHIPADEIRIGNDPGNGNYLNGLMANMQVYNIALSQGQITALYQEGIGGDPIDLSHLVAWYPLNGNANDYSGNDYNGNAINVGYSSTWYRTYSAP